MSLFVDYVKTNEEAFAPGDFSFKTPASQGGSFVAALQPDQYYFVKFAHVGYPPGIFGFRTYMPLLGSKVVSGGVITIEITPGRAT